MRKTACPVVWEGGGAQSPPPDPIKKTKHRLVDRPGGLSYASAFLQYSTDLAISVSTSEPAGTGYSNSMVPWTGYFSSFMSCSTSLLGVSPCPQVLLGPF